MKPLKQQRVKVRANSPIEGLNSSLAGEASSSLARLLLLCWRGFFFFAGEASSSLLARLLLLRWRGFFFAGWRGFFFPGWRGFFIASWRGEVTHHVFEIEYLVTLGYGFDFFRCVNDNTK